jgi:hypothetical protein
MDNPQELIQILVDAGPEELDRSVVDRFLVCGQVCVGPLVEAIRTSDNDPALARALILLGEIGDPSVMSVIALYFADDEEDEDAVNEMADWAFQRVIARYPVEAITEIRRMAADANVAILADLGRHLSTAAGTPGRAEALLTFEDRLDDPDFDEVDRSTLVSTMIATALFMEGSGSELAKSFRTRHGNLLDADNEEMLRYIEKEVQGQTHPPDELPDVYEVFCPEMIEEPIGPYVRPEPKIGRNNPCWCGSGKKYKKCHLAADEAE